MPRPATPPLVKGDALLLHPGSSRWWPEKLYEVRVVGLGPKWVTVIAAASYEAFLADPPANRWRTRRFTLADMREGEPGKRVGYPATLVTREQAAYEARRLAAGKFLNEVLGVVVANRQSPLHDPDRLIAFADFLRASRLDILLPSEATDDDA